MMDVGDEFLAEQLLRKHKDPELYLVGASEDEVFPRYLS